MNDATPTATPALHEQYNSFSTVILELPNGNVTEFVERTANDIEYAFKRLDTYRSIANTQTSNIDSVKEYLLDNYEELETHADEIAQLLDIELTREVEYTVTMTATVTVTLTPGDDAESIISDNLYIDSNSGSISVDDYEVDYSNES
jgi:uncharacterized membrane-anchored protein YhcB (DUF1043 family)